MSDTNRSEIIQFCTALVCVSCAIASVFASVIHPKWRKHNYLYVNQTVVRCAATCSILLLTLIPADLVLKEVVVVPYFIIVTMCVVGSAHAAALAHIYVALRCHEIPDEESVVTSSCYQMTLAAGLVLYIVNSVLSLELWDVVYIMEVLLSAISTGNVMCMSRLFNIFKKCRIPCIWFVVSLGTFCDVLLIFYGALLVHDDSVGLLNDVLQGIWTGVIVLNTILILCSKDHMDWKKYGSSSADVIEM